MIIFMLLFVESSELTLRLTAFRIADEVLVNVYAATEFSTDEHIEGNH